MVPSFGKKESLHQVEEPSFTQLATELLASMVSWPEGVAGKYVQRCGPTDLGRNAR
jgi:hypothetical protein